MQAALTWFYLVKRAEYLTSNIMDSCRDELLKLWEREGLVRYLVITPTQAVGERGPGALPSYHPHASCGRERAWCVT